MGRLEVQEVTHDELLAMCDNYSFKDSAEPVKALRAVVELHKPTPEGRYSKILCQGCSMTEVNLYVDYPCQTIRVIEKELS
jgi:hypothetical protein